MRHIAGVLIIIVAVIVVVPSTGWADWRDFVPRLVLPGADLSVYTSYSSTDSSGAGNSVKSRFFLSGEELNLYTSGYSYDPRFVQFRLAIGIGLRQQYESSSGIASKGWQTGEAKDYRFDMLVLDQHPYNLSLYAYRTEPLVVGSAGTEPLKAQTGKGAIFRYKKKPYFFTTGYTTTSYETSGGTSTSDAFANSATYLKQYETGNSLSFSGDYTHRTFSAPLTPGGTSNYYLFNNLINFAPVGLNSTVTRSDDEEGTLTGSFSNKALSWTESLNASLPLNFGVGLSSNYQKNTNTVADSTAPSSEVSSTDKGIAFSITHRLYESMTSLYTFSQDRTSSPSGDTDQTSHQLSFTYTKTIPWGRLLSGVSLQRTTVDNSGETQVVNEPHPAVAVPGFFALLQQEPDPATIRVYVKFPVEPFEIIPLQEGVNYTVTPVNNTFQINIISLPSQFILPGAFDFFVSYSIQRAQFKIQSDALSYNIGLNLFNNLLYPFYNYSTISSKTISGALPGGAPPLESTTNTVGLVVHKEPFRLLVQYQNTDSNVSSNTAWRAEADYNKAVTDTSQVFATATYDVINYPSGTSAQSTQPFTQTTATFSANIVKRFPERGLTLTGGGSFSYLKSLTTSTAYGLTSSLSWLIGKLTISMGANVYLSQSEGENALHVQTVHQYYYLNVKRRIY